MSVCVCPRIKDTWFSCACALNLLDSWRVRCAFPTVLMCLACPTLSFAALQVVKESASTYGQVTAPAAPTTGRRGSVREGGKDRESAWQNMQQHLHKLASRGPMAGFVPAVRQRSARALLSHCPVARGCCPLFVLSLCCERLLVSLTVLPERIEMEYNHKSPTARPAAPCWRSTWPRVFTFAVTSLIDAFHRLSSSRRWPRLSWHP